MNENKIIMAANRGPYWLASLDEEHKYPDSFF